MKRKKIKVLVGMSGGVDSSVAALLLKKRGFQIAGGFMIFEGGDKKCCSDESMQRAHDVAISLKIPFYLFDLRQEFKNRIINRFVGDSKAGMTPNPCVDCNKEIKFGLFLEKALALGFNYVATGHYARLRQELSVFSLKLMNGKLLKAKDKQKDQSYFLWRLNQNQLRHIFFPLGEYTKKKVRALARKNNLSSADTKESQEICFAPAGSASLLKSKIGENDGLILDVEGREIGRHKGVHFYTIGQRKGLNLPGGPFFAVKKDVKDNKLIVSKNKKDILSREAILSNVNWVSGNAPKLSSRVFMRARYRQDLFGVKIKKENSNRYRVIFDKPQIAVTPGQSAVFYKKSELLGGGVIMW